MKIGTLIATLAVLCLSLTTQAQGRPGQLPPDVERDLLGTGWFTGDLDDLIETARYTSGHNGVEHTFFRQRWQGIEVWNGDIALHRTADGRTLRVNNTGWQALERRVNATEPTLTAGSAMEQVIGRTAPGIPVPALLGVEEGGRLHRYDGTLFGGEPVLVRLVYQPMGDSLRLAWNVNHYLSDGSHWWNIRIDALTGEELDRNDWVVSCGLDHDHSTHHPEVDYSGEDMTAMMGPNDYRVFAWPNESPSHGARTMENAPWLDGGIASPFGWHDTNGAPGPEFTDTRGNNVYAQEDADANNTGGFRPDGGPGLEFDFSLNLTQAPSNYQSASITNLFYWNNVMHDLCYQYGFDEASGNFQQNNYGRGGLGNDPVQADAQDGSGTNNANFGTPPDGSNPRMQMFIWTQTSPNRDSSFDNGVVAHEYGHGVSNRLVAGPANVSCLSNAEQMGEGWSDYFSLITTIKPGDTRTQGRGIGTYLLGQPTTGVGIRPARYSTSFSVNGFTYASTNNTAQISQPHGIGFVWCTMLWEMTWDLIDLHGLAPDIYAGTGGNNIALQLVMDGLKLTPCQPGFVDARDAILLADQITYGGIHQNLIWAAFARRGLGASASQGSSTSRTDQVEAFDMPLDNNVGVAAIISPPAGQVLDCEDTAVPVIVQLRNYGLTAQANFPVTYQYDGGTAVEQVFSGTLGAGASIAFTFDTVLLLGDVGQRTLVASTQLPGDQFTGDDQSAVEVDVIAGVTVEATFSEGLSSASPTPPGWRLENPDNAVTWTTRSLTIGPDCSADLSWAINHYTYNAPGQEDRLITPQIELLGSAGSKLLFHHAYRPYSATYSDGLRVEVSADCGASWNTVFQQQGAQLATGSNLTSSYTPSNCNQWRLNEIDLTDYDGASILVRFVSINGYGNWLYLDNVLVERNGIAVAVRLMLDGAYEEATDRMKDGLRVAGLIPASEPYSAQGLVAQGAGGETLNASLLELTGDDAIVDWVLIELRDANAPSLVLAQSTALLQRDGVVVDRDGRPVVAFDLEPGDHYVAVRHRNHLGCMTATALPFSTATVEVDLSDPATPAYGIESRRIRAGRALLWAGNVVADDAVRYSGADNDRDQMLQAIGGVVPTNTVGGYLQEDVNLDGQVRYAGNDNDRDIILQTIGGVVPTFVRQEQLP